VALEGYPLSDLPDTLQENYSLELVQFRLSHCCDKANNVADYCAVVLYLHAFSATALDEDVQLSSTSIGYFPPDKITGT